MQYFFLLFRKMIEFPKSWANRTELKYVSDYHDMRKDTGKRPQRFPRQEHSLQAATSSQVFPHTPALGTRLQ